MFVGDLYAISPWFPYYLDFVHFNKVQVLWKPWCIEFGLPVAAVAVATMLAIKKML